MIDDSLSETFLLEKDVCYSEDVQTGVSYYCSKLDAITEGFSVNIKHGNDNKIYFGKSCTILKSRALIAGNGNTVIFGPYCDLNNLDIRIKGNNNTIIIGAFTSIGSAKLIAIGGKSINISPFCMFSTGIIVDTSDHHSIYDLDTGLKINIDADVNLNEKVWIGRNVVINKGTMIGANTVIAQGSICTGSIDSNSIYAGVPARQLKSNITWSRMPANSIEEMESSARNARWEEKVANLKSYLALNSMNK